MPLSPKQLRIIATLATGESQNEAARCHRVSQNTVSTWLKDPEFKEALNQATLAVWDEALRAAVGRVAAAIETVDGIRTNERVKAADRLQACKMLISLAEKVKLAEIERRVEVLEQAQASEQNPPT